MAAMLGSVSSVSWCDRDPPHHERIAGAPRHPRLENEPKCKKAAKEYNKEH